MKSLTAVLQNAFLSDRSFPVCALLFFFHIGLCAAQGPVTVKNLSPAHPISFVLANEGELRLQIDFGEAQAQEIFVQTAAPDVTFRIETDDHNVIQTGQISTTGWAAITVVAAKHQQIQLSLMLDHAIEELSGVHLWIESVNIPLNALAAYDRAARLLSTAQALHNSLRAEDLRLAILKYRQAAAEWHELKDFYGASVALGGESETQYELSQFPEALRSVSNAIAQEPPDAYLQAWLEHLEARVYLAEWDGSPAKTHAQHSLQLAQKMNEPALIATALSDLGEAIVYTGESDEENYADEALTQALSTGLPETVAVAKRVQAWIDEGREGMGDALTLLNQAQIWFHRAGDVRTELQAMEELAVPLHFTGDTYQALTRTFKFEPISRASGDAVDWGVLLDNMGVWYTELGRPHVAILYYKKARAAYASAHFQYGLTLIYGELCEAENGFHQVSHALSDCAQSYVLAQQLKIPAITGMAQMRLGVAEYAAGLHSKALKRLREAVTSSESARDTQMEVKEHLRLGEFLEAAGNTQEAFSEYSNAQRISRKVTDQAFLLEAQYHVAGWSLQKENYEEAYGALKPALDIIEAKRLSVTNGSLKTSYFANKRKCYELGIKLRMNQFKSAKDSGAGAAQALELSEQSRARELLDELNAKSTTAERRREHVQVDLVRSNSEVDHAFDHRLKLLVEGGTGRDLQLSAAELTQALANLELAEQDVKSVSNQTLKSAVTMTVSEIEQASSHTQASFFEYALGDKQSYLWVVSNGDKLQSYELPPRRQLENMVNQWRTLASSNRSAEGQTFVQLRRLSAQLSCTLLKDYVPADTEQIVVVPDGELAMLPFGALPENGCSKKPGEPLVGRYQITMTPSLSVFFSRKSSIENKTFQGEVAVIADPVFDMADTRTETIKKNLYQAGSQTKSGVESGTSLPRLVHTGYEANAIKETVRELAGGDRVFLARGFDASIQTILSEKMLDYRVWHLATHGVYDQAIPEFSGLVFSLLGHDGKPRFGFLKAQDIARLNLPAELVVLSACDSAKGDNVNGEGVMGLSYAFLHAGARQVISTLWGVDDAKSTKLMIAFYREFMRNGGIAAEALRKSQIKLMRTPATSSPYFWAGFTLTTAAN